VDRFPRRPMQCKSFFGECDYFPICQTCGGMDRTKHYVEGPEVENDKKEDSDGD